MKAFLKEIRDFYKFFNLPKLKKQIVFYSEHGGYYASFEGIILELSNKHRQHIVYITSDIKDPILKVSNDAITPLYINKTLSFFMPLVDSRVFVMTLTDLDNHYIKRSKNPVHYIYVPHSLVSVHMAYNFGAFDHYDTIMCAGPHHVRELKRQEELYKLKPKKLIEAGYYRLERIYDTYSKIQKTPPDIIQKTILLAPSWGKDNIIESCGPELIDALLNKGHRVIVRPHPETIIRYPKLINYIEGKFKNSANFFLERSVAGDDSILNADLLICDCSGIALEYALGTERPVLFIDVPVKIKNKRFEELGIEPTELKLRNKIGKIVSVGQIQQIAEYAELLIKDSNSYKINCIEARKSTVCNFKNSSEVISNYIINLIQ